MAPDPVVTPTVIAVKAAPLAARLLRTAAGRVRDMALGDEGERGLNEAFERALERVYRATVEEVGSDVSSVLDSILRDYVDDPLVAEALVDAGILNSRPDLSLLRLQFETSFDVETLPIALDELLEMMVTNLRQEFSAEIQTNDELRSRFVASATLAAQDDKEFLGAGHEFTRGEDLREASLRIT